MELNVRRSATREFEVYEISDLVIDVARQRVTRAATEVALPNLSFDLLLVLIRAAPAVVSNDDLMAQVWPGLVVSPETVSQRVKLLRDALGDDPRAPRYIAGLRGRGYRLIPEVRSISEKSSHSSPQPGPVESESAESPPLRSTEPDMTSQPRARARTRVTFGVFAALALMGVATYAFFALRPEPTAPQPDSVTVVGLPPRTVAVLPFENLSPDPANEYLALGMAEMVLNRLANVSELVVIARASSFKAAEGSTDARETGKMLNARYLVEGGVQREGEKLRVTARLIDAQSGAQLQALRFDRTLADVFSIQDEIAEKVAEALEASLSNTAAGEKPGARSANLNAYLAYLQGRVLLAKYTVDGFEAATEQFERAIALDPNFAAAYVGLADAQMSGAWRRNEVYDVGSMLAAPVGKKAAALIDTALALDPSLGEAYLVRAQWLTQSEADFRKGLELDPSNGPGLTRFGEFLTGRSIEGRAMLDRALLVDPLSARAYYLRSNLAETEAEAEQMLVAALKIDPQFTSVLKQLSWLRAFQGKFAEGVMLAERAIAADPKNPSSRWRQSAYNRYLELGDLAAARDVIAESSAAGLAPFQEFQYLGDWRAAGEAVYDVPERLRSFYNDWLAAEAVRDLALHTGNFRRAIRFIDSGGLGLPEPRKVDPVTIYVAVPLAHLLQANGQRAESEKLLDDALAWVNRKRDPAREYLLWFPLRRVRADALALQGHRDAAIAELAEALRSGGRNEWWYTIERDPVWEPMRSDPRFQAIAAEARAHAAAQRALLEEMRRKGEVPYRPSKQ